MAEWAYPPTHMNDELHYMAKADDFNENVKAIQLTEWVTAPLIQTKHREESSEREKPSTSVVVILVVVPSGSSLGLRILAWAMYTWLFFCKS